MTDELLLKYISGQARTEDTIDVQDWIDGSEVRKRELARLTNVWILAGLENEIEAGKKDAEINRILGIIKRLNIQEKKKAIRLKFMQYAAVILLIIGFSGMFGYFISSLPSTADFEYTEIIVPKGERSMVILPDGSKVQLNSDSKMKFVSSFRSAKRRVILNGEGFFQVVPDKSRPFVVEVPGIEIEVLGTSFNVSSYPNDSLITTFLESGKVKINNNVNENIFLNPQEAYLYNKITQESMKMKLDDQRFSNWTKGLLTINGETIGELAKKLERRFNVRIIFKDSDVKNHIYTGSIKDENLITVLEALEFASSVSYKYNGDTITLFSN